MCARIKVLRSFLAVCNSPQSTAKHKVCRRTFFFLLLLIIEFMQSYVFDQLCKFIMCTLLGHKLTNTVYGREKIELKLHSNRWGITINNVMSLWKFVTTIYVHRNYSWFTSQSLLMIQWKLTLKFHIIQISPHHTFDG